MFSQRTDESRYLQLTSSKNSLLKEIRKAVSIGGLTDSGLAVAEGFHLLEEALASAIGIDCVLASETAWPAVEQILGDFAGRVFHLKDDLFHTVSGTQSSQGVITLVRPPSWEPDAILKSSGLAVVLDGIQDPGNAGSIFRSAEAFGISGALLLKGTVNPWNPKTVRGSAGSVYRLPCISGLEEDVVAGILTRYPIQIYAAMPRARLSLCDADLRGAAAVILGSEGRGISRKLLDTATPVSIPTGGVESLNVATAAAVIFYEASRQRRPAG